MRLPGPGVVAHRARERCAARNDSKTFDQQTFEARAETRRARYDRPRSPPGRASPRIVGSLDSEKRPLGSHRLIRARYLSRPLKEGFSLGGRKGLCGYRILDAAAARGDKCKHRRSLRIWHIRDEHKVVLTKREIQADQLPARLFAKLGNRRLPVVGFSQTDLDVF